MFHYRYKRIDIRITAQDLLQDFISPVITGLLFIHVFIKKSFERIKNILFLIIFNHVKVSYRSYNNDEQDIYFFQNENKLHLTVKVEHKVL